MDCFLLGYLILLHERDADWVPDPLPMCPCSEMYTVLPDGGLVEWMIDDSGAKKLQARLGLEKARWAAARAWCTAQHDRGLDFVVFYTREAACTFRNRFLDGIPNLRLIGLYLDAASAERFDREAPNANPGFHFHAVLSRREPFDPTGCERVLGFEILHTNDGMSLHSPYCYSQDAYLTKPPFTRNAAGLFDRFEEAKNAWVRAEQAAVEADRCLWHPCMITEVVGARPNAYGVSP